MRTNIVRKYDYLLILYAICTMILAIFYSGCTHEIHRDKHGIKVTYKVPVIGHGRSVAKLFYKNKIISSNLFYAKEDSYILSPDKKLILFIEHSLGAKRYGIYIIPEDRTIYFHQTYYIIELSHFDEESHKIEWKKDKIILSYYTDECILHISDVIMEKVRRTEIDSKDFLSYRSLYEYLLMLIKQLYEHLDKSDQQKYLDAFKPYLNMFPIKDYFKEIVYLKLRENKWHFNKLGETFNELTRLLKSKYGKTMMFKIFEKNFREKFDLRDGNVKLRSKGLLW